MRIRHQHFSPVAPLPGEPELFTPDFGIEPMRAIRPGDFEPPSVSVDTSRQAAAKITKHTARIREAIYLWLRTQGLHGATDGEICAALDLNPSTERPRRRELEGNAPWAPGLPARIQRSPNKRQGMRIYTVAHA